MTIKQYIKSLEKSIAYEGTTQVEGVWLKERLSDMEDAIKTLGEKEVKDLCVHVISGKTDRVSIDFFALCYGYARAYQLAYTVWDDDRMNAQSVKIYEAWKQHHA